MIFKSYDNYLDLTAAKLNNGRLFFVGGGGFFTEIELFLVDILAEYERIRGRSIELKRGGVFDKTISENTYFEWQVFDNEGNFDFLPGDVCVIAMGNSAKRRKVAKKLADRVDLMTVIHPKAYVAQNAEISDGSIVAPNCFLGANSKMGRNCVMHNASQLGHDSQIGDHSVLCPFAALSGNASVGEASFLGTSSVLAPSVQLGMAAKISALSFVKKSEGDFFAI